jgi:hypothetical protein
MSNRHQAVTNRELFLVVPAPPGISFRPAWFLHRRPWTVRHGRTLMRSRIVAAAAVAVLLLGSLLAGGCKKSGSGGSGGYLRAPGASAPAGSSS